MNFYAALLASGLSFVVLLAGAILATYFGKVCHQTPTDTILKTCKNLINSNISVLNDFNITCFHKPNQTVPNDTNQRNQSTQSKSI